MAIPAQAKGPEAVAPGELEWLISRARGRVNPLGLPALTLPGACVKIANGAFMQGIGRKRALAHRISVCLYLKALPAENDHIQVLKALRSGLDWVSPLNLGTGCVTIMDNWDEIRTAYQVARMGTVSGAAGVLGVHHATVIRHIDALETRLGEKLFQRHARGYTATEAGRDLLAVAQVTEDQFLQLANRIRGNGETVTGDLVVTAISDFGGFLSRALVKFQGEHPGLVVRLLTGPRLFRLDYGEAHIALRAGAAPSEPDYVVQPFLRMASALCASRSYADKYGLPQNEADLKDHCFVGSNDPDSRAPFYNWLNANIPAAKITYRVTEYASGVLAVRAGAGLGFVSTLEAKDYPDLVEVMPPRPEWDTPTWLVTHVDLHRTLKVQRFLAYLKADVSNWTAQ